MKYKVKESNKKIRSSWSNTRLHQAIKNFGYVSPKQFADAIGVAPTTVYDYLSCNISPMELDGSFRASAKAIMDDLCVLPQEIWDMENLDAFGGSCVIDVEQDLTEFDLPYEAMLKKEGKEIFVKFTETLTKRQAFIFNCFVLDGCTLQNIGDNLGVGRERIRQIVLVLTRRFEVFKKNLHRNLVGSNSII